MIDLQRRLLALGFDPGPADGRWGPRTKDAAMAALERLGALVRPPPPVAPSAPVVDHQVALEVAAHEAVIRQAYRDSVGVWTWSVGLTSATGHTVERYIGNPQPLQHCLDIYVWALRRYSAQVLDVFAGHPLTQAEFAAALSFHWNTGAIRRASWVGHFRRGDMAAARAAFMAWNQPPEIRRRRAAEARLLFDGEWSNDGRMVEYTRLTPRHTPVWSSAIRRDVRAEMMIAFGHSVDPPLDAPPRPESQPAAPTLSP